MEFLNKDEYVKKAYERHKNSIESDINADLMKQWFKEDVERNWNHYKEVVDYITVRLNSPVFEPHNINLQLNKERMYFSINKYGMRYIFKISNYEPDEQYMTGCITLECTQYIPDTGFNSFDMKNLLHIECLKHTVLNVVLYAQVYNIAQVEKLIATILDINDNDVHITFEDPVTDVIVHKVVGLPVYYFHTEGIKHLVTIERSSSENRDYLIKISTSNKDNTMLDMGGIKTGRLFRTVLLKRLNDWYKETYNKRACFKWGANVTMD